MRKKTRAVARVFLVAILLSSCGERVTTPSFATVIDDIRLSGTCDLVVELDEGVYAVNALIEAPRDIDGFSSENITLNCKVTDCKREGKDFSMDVDFSQSGIKKHSIWRRIDPYLVNGLWYGLPPQAGTSQNETRIYKLSLGAIVTTLEKPVAKFQFTIDEPNRIPDQIKKWEIRIDRYYMK